MNRRAPPFYARLENPLGRRAGRAVVHALVSGFRVLPFVLFALALPLLSLSAEAQSSFLSAALRRDQYRNGEDTLRAFAAVSQATRLSIVKLNVDGATVALGAVVDSSGLVLTKASELKKGKLTCWLASEKEVPAEILARDDDEDVALVRVHAPGLKPIAWASDEPALGQWAITPGIADTPHAVGIISALPHAIKFKRAVIGIAFDPLAPAPTLDRVMPGLSAEKAGLKVGDIIVSLNHVTVTNRAQVVDTLREFHEGQTITLHIRRGKKEFEKDLPLTIPTSPDQVQEFYPEERYERLGGDVSHRSKGFERVIEHDSILQPWLCGGPLVNLDGKAIGLNIARASRVTTYALPASLVQRLCDRLKTQAKFATKSSGNP